MNINLITGVLLMILIYSVCIAVITERTVTFCESEYPDIIYRGFSAGAVSAFRKLSALCRSVRQAARGGLIF